MSRSGGLHRCGGMLRATGLLLVLSYILASGLGATGGPACIHAGLGEEGAQGHAGHAPAGPSASPGGDGHSRAEGHSSTGNSTADESGAPSEDTGHPCDCLAHCSIGGDAPAVLAAALFDLSGRPFSVAHEAPVDTVRGTVSQHRLPLPNAPPLF